ncbi:MAG: type I-U CRISPR-associated protein Csb2 [Enhygromyxa sp.]
MISLCLELLTGRYVASEFNNRNRAEWPPHPARVFSALVAAYHESDRPPHGEEALRWLERLGAPQLTFSAAHDRDLKTNFVPVNDKAISDASMVDNAWKKVFGASTDKQRTKAEAALTKAYAKVGAETTSLGKKFREVAAHVLPATRTKQPRTFPTVIPEDPVVYLTWEETPNETIRAGLDAIAAALVRVGHSSSLVAARWTEAAPAPTWVPHTSGTEVLRWVGPGQFDALGALHESAPFSEQRVMPYKVARYGRARPLVAVHSSCFAANFIVLRRVAGPRLPILASEPIADAVRRALMSHAQEPIPPLISGHLPDAKPVEQDHLAVIPLAYVESAHASGDVLGVALVPPAGLSIDELRPLYAAIARWESATEGNDSEPRSILTLGSLGRWELERVRDIAPLYNLRESTWTRTSTSWASVTPMVLDRHPGSFTRDRDRAIHKAHASIDAACERIGLPRPAEIELSSSPFFKGSEQAHRFRRRNGNTDRRPLTHVRLRFECPVTGPVLLGAGRYRGLGLFRPWSEKDRE